MKPRFATMPAAILLLAGHAFAQLPGKHKKNPHIPYRAIDGSHNNVEASKAAYGAAGISFFRELPAAYDIVDPHNAMNGTGRPTARAISNLLCHEPQSHYNGYDVSMFSFTWGQFIDHDITLTEEGFVEYAPITLPPNDPVFTMDIPFFRSVIRAGTGQSTPREQTNLNTSWIDGSVVYGSDSARAAWLRTFQDGKLRTSAGNLMPWNTVTGEYADAIDPQAPFMANDSGHTVKTYVAGDIRAAEQPGIMTMQTLFAREHNRICNRLIAEGVTGDESIYQQARKEVGAIIQAITYNEFLPALGVDLPKYKGYDKQVIPDIANTFAAAGFRLGHTLVADSVPLRDDDCKEMAPGAMTLKQVFFDPGLMMTYGPDPFLKGYATQKTFETDIMINSVLRNFLFGPGFGLDLASINIQRGRDHGLPDYNTVRSYYTGKPALSFADITSDPARQNHLAQLYGHVNNMDLWVGLLSEDRMPGVSVPMTIRAILRDQFTRLRDGDYYFYLHDPYLYPKVRARVKHTRLSEVIERNTNITSLQKNVFFMDQCPGDDGEMRLAGNSGTANAFSVYPNPVTDGRLVIRLPETADASRIVLSGVTGQAISTLVATPGMKELVVSMKGLPAGVYLVHGLMNGVARVHRIVHMPVQ